MNTGATALACLAQQLPGFNLKDCGQALKHIDRRRRLLALEQAHISPIHFGEISARFLRQPAIGAKTPHVLSQDRANRHAPAVTIVDFLTTEYILKSSIRRAAIQFGLRICGGGKLRITYVGLMALALAGCKRVDANGNDIAESDQPQILDLLREGDIAACAHPAVMSVFKDNSRVPFEEAQQKLSLTRDQYDAVALDDFSFKEISTTKADKAIAEVQCEANLYAIDHNLGVVRYSVRPSSAGDGIVVSYDENIGQMLSLAKLDHANALKSAVPKAPSPPAQSAGPTTEAWNRAGDEGEPEQAPAADTTTPATAYDKAKAALLEASASEN